MMSAHREKKSKDKQGVIDRIDRSQTYVALVSK